MNSVYLDNSSLELYHSLLDKKPGATTMRIRCRPYSVVELKFECPWTAQTPAVYDDAVDTHHHLGITCAGST